MTLDEFKSQWFDCNDFIVAHTSGSTGAPKEVRLPKSDMVCSARATNSFFSITSSSRLLLPLSLDYIAGKMMEVRAFEANCELVVVAPSNRFEVPEGKFDLVAVVPTQVDWLLANPQWTERLRHVIVGGAPLAVDSEKALKAVGYDAWCTYGMTETCSHVAVRPCDGADSPYQAMPGIRFDVDDRGCLVIEAPHFSFGRLVTNDSVELLSPVSFRWKGRIDNVINSGGLKLHPEEIERLYAPYIQTPFYLRGTPDPKWGQALELVIEGKGLAEETLACLSQIDHKLHPKIITFVETIPRTSTGKILRR